MKKIDSSYSRESILSDIKYDILKRAPSKFGMSKASNKKGSPAPLEEHDQATINTTGANSTSSTASQSVPSHSTPSQSEPPHLPSSSSMLTNGLANYTDEVSQKFTQPPMHYWDYYSPYYYHQ